MVIIGYTCFQPMLLSYFFILLLHWDFHFKDCIIVLCILERDSDKKEHQAL